jgi:hypothetical protein
VLPEHAEELTMPAQKRFWLDKKERLFPGPNHPGQQHQEEPVGLWLNWSFDPSMKDDQLVS